jgi:hypothetical protein
LVFVNCEGVGFKYLYRGLKPSYKFPIDPTIKHYLQKKSFEGGGLIKELHGKEVTITTDIWTNNALD